MREGVKFSQVMEVVNSKLPLGVKVEEKAAWVKLDAANGNKIYISKRDIVRQIDLSGFGRDMEGTYPPPRKNGRVEACLDVSDPDFFFFLEKALETMALTPEQTAPVRNRENSNVSSIQPLPSRARRNTAPTSPPPTAPMPEARNPRRHRTTMHPDVTK